jgi:uncharacterized protein YkwD
MKNYPSEIILLNNGIIFSQKSCFLSELNIPLTPMNLFKTFALSILTCIILIPVSLGHNNQFHDFEGFTNARYAAYLATQGWPVDLLNTAKDANYLTDDEKNLVLAMNLIRHDPSKYADLYVKPLIQYFDGKLLKLPGRVPLRTTEGAGAVKELARVLSRAKPAPLLKPSRGMSMGSKDHAQYMKKRGTASHDGQGGMGARLNKHGKWLGSIGENLAWNISNAHDTILALMIDDGIKNRGHRINIMRENYTKVGLAKDDHPRFSNSWVINYANDFEEK